MLALTFCKSTRIRSLHIPAALRFTSQSIRNFGTPKREKKPCGCGQQYACIIRILSTYARWESIFPYKRNIIMHCSQCLCIASSMNNLYTD